MQMIISALSLTLLVSVSAQTLVQFYPESVNGASAPVAAGFAYAFQAPVQDGKSSTLGLRVKKNVIDAGYDVPISKKGYSKKPVVAKKLNIPQVMKTQYHSQDELGQYAYGYFHDDASHHEERTVDGGVTGSYTYYDNQGNKKSANYKADRNGYRLESSNLQQEPIEQTAEVQAATLAHLQAVENARYRMLQDPTALLGFGDTPEVAAAKAAHLKAYNEIKERHSRRYRRSAHRPSSLYKQTLHHSPGSYAPQRPVSYAPVPHAAPHVPAVPTLAVQKATYEHLKAKDAAIKYGPSAHVGIQQTPAVQRATYEHLRAKEETLKYGGPANVRVQDTPAVVAGRNAHIQAYNKIARDHARRWKRSVPSAYRSYAPKRPVSYAPASYAPPHVPVAPTFAVQQATYEHLKAKDAAIRYGPSVHVGIQQTPAVQRATYEHLRAKEETLKYGGPVNVGVHDTPAVVAGRNAHIYAYNKIAQDHARRWRRSVPSAYRSYAPKRPVSYAPASYAAPHVPVAPTLAVQQATYEHLKAKDAAIRYGPSVHVGIQQTPAVQRATYEHLRAKEETLKYGGPVNVGVHDTPAVVAGRNAHIYAYNKIAQDHARRWRRSVPSAYGNVYDTSATNFDDGSYRADQHFPPPADDGQYRPEHHFSPIAEDGQYRSEQHFGGGSTHSQAINYAAQQPQQRGPDYYAQDVSQGRFVIPGVATPEVQRATQAHLQAVHEAHTYGVHNHQGVADTPQVAAAKQAHLHQFKQIQQDIARRWRRSVPSAYSNQYASTATHFDDGTYRADQHFAAPADDGQYRAEQHFSPIAEDGKYRPEHHSGAGSAHSQAVTYAAQQLAHSQTYQPQQGGPSYYAQDVSQGKFVIPGVATPEVQRATQAHLQAVHEAHTYGAHNHQGVADTPDVAAAKAAHLHQFKQIQQDIAKKW